VDVAHRGGQPLPRRRAPQLALAAFELVEHHGRKDHMMPAARPPRPRVDRWAYAVALLAIGALFVFFVLPGLLVDDADFPSAADRYKAKNDVRATGIQLLGGLVLIVGAYFTARTFGLNREGQITDRFSKAVDHLGSDKEATRLGGIYALERITQSDRHEQGPIMEILCAYVREASQVTRGASPALPRDVQSALIVIGRRPPDHDPAGYRLDLSGANLASGTLRGSFADADLSGARLVDADLRGVDLSGATLPEAVLTKAKIEGAVFAGADVSRADLTRTEVEAADFSGARQAAGSAVWPVGVEPPANLA